MNQRTRARVLIVEDEAIVALDIQSRLRNMGYEVVRQVSSGEDAVAAARDIRPDLILMDIMLDGAMDGIQAAEAIRSESPIPIIYLTAYADETTLQRAKVTDPFGYIIKPFEDRELSVNIEMALYKNQMDRKVRDHERWLVTTLKSIGDGVITTDGHGAITFLNPEAQRMLGVENGRAVGRELDAVVHFVSEGSGELLLDMAGRALRGEQRGELAADLVLVTAAGARVPVQVNIAPIARGDGATLGTVLVIRDVSERRNAEMEIKKQVRQLKLTLKRRLATSFSPATPRQSAGR